MAGNGRRATNEALLTALACGATVESAARTVGVSVRTIHRRLKDPGFQEQLRKLRSDMLERAGAMLTAMAMESVKTLVALQAASMPPAVRLGAARAALDLGVKFRESQELEQRIAALEAQLANVETAGRPLDAFEPGR
jgi:hypothetical protein